MKAAVLTVSDSCASGQKTDESGPAVERLLIDNGIEVCARETIADEYERIAEILKHYCDNAQPDLVLTTGGTGLGPRDVTPEATQSVCEKIVPGLAELMRAAGLEKTRNAVLSRAMAGIRKGTLIINLPGSTRGATESLESIIDILPHAVHILHGGGH